MRHSFFGLPVQLGSSLRRLITGAAILALTSLTPAYSQISQTFGKISPGTIASAGLSADMKRASRFSLGSAGTLSQLCAYLDGKGGASGTQPFRLALYRDNGGVPGTKVLDADGGGIQSGTAARWYCIDTAIFPIEAGSYWIAIHSSGTAGVIRDYYDGPNNWYGNADSYADGASTSFGTGNAGSGTLTVAAEYFASTEMRTAGRTTIGTVPSGGMSADFKRGSSFTMPERGKLYSIAAYLDGNGAPGLGNVSQTVHYAIYKDANGVPGALVYKSDYDFGYVYSSALPSWYPTFPVNPNSAPTLEPGKYWIVLLTGANGGIARNFADGTGNWYGNADAANDGPSDPFGVGNTGNGTISAFISYRPGAGITNDELGRTDAAATPSAGLSPNVTRYSYFLLDYYKGNPTLTGLRAYLDGLGGAGGSQKVRMVLYHGSFHVGDTTYIKVAESDEVTIPAGMSPRWVDFHVPAAVLPTWTPSFTIAIQTGDTAGVIRDYGDTRFGPINSPTPDGNWASIQDTYSDGALDYIPEDGHLPAPGSVTMSVYATYSEEP
jgi:hypothetical protein